MDFVADKKTTVLLDPRQDMARRAIPSEIRQDPLTKRTSRICHFMDLKWPKPDFESLTAGTAKTCPFCPGRIMDVTPCFPEELIAEGRIVAGDIVLFPNVAPYDALSAVAVMSGRHFIPMMEIEPGLITANLEVCLDFFRRIHQSGHPESVYHLINWNYMPPSGSSLIHPHLQVFISSHAPNLMRRELEAAREYLARRGANYWDDLIKAEEARRERFLTRIGRTVWLTAYAPLGVAGDVLAVVEGAHSTLELTAADLRDLALGLTKTMRAYDQMGVYSFNMNFFTGAAAEKSAAFHLVFSPRTFFNQALGTPDVGALRNLFNESLCMAFPEEIADKLRPHFEPAGPR